MNIYLELIYGFLVSTTFSVQQQVEDQQQRSVENPEESCSSLESNCHPEPIAEPPTRPTEEPPLSPTLATTESNSHSGEFNLASLSSDSGIQFGRGTEETSGADYGLSSSVKTSDSEKSPSRKTIDDDVDLNDLNQEDDVEDPEDHLQIIEETGGQRRVLLSPSSTTCSRNRRHGSSSSTSSSDLSDREMYTATVGVQQQQDDLDDSSGGLRRSNSVRARANMFQQLESRMKENENPAANAPRGRRGEYQKKRVETHGCLCGVAKLSLSMCNTHDSNCAEIGQVKCAIFTNFEENLPLITQSDGVGFPESHHARGLSVSCRGACVAVFFIF